MAYSAHTLVAFGGKLTNNTTPDEWQCGVRLRLLQPDNISQGNGLTDPAAYLAAIYGPLQTWFQQALVTTAGSERCPLRADAYLDWVKVNNIATTGKYADPTHVNRHDYSGTVGGGGSANIIPPFITAAVSFTTALTRGPGHRGRIYLPFSLALSTTGFLTAAQQAQCNGTAKNLLSTLKTPTDANGTIIPCIASKVNGSRAAITGVATGNVFDVQRRRKDDLQQQETYVSVTFP